MATDNMGLVRRFVEEVWNKGDLSVIDELVSDKYVGTEPMIGKPMKDRDIFDLLGFD